MNIFSMEAIESVKTKDVLYLEAGIHDNVTLTNVRIDKTPNTGATFVEFTFTDERGATLKSTEFEPTRQSGQTQDSWEDVLRRRMKRLTNIVLLYYNKKDFDGVTWTDWSDFFNWAIEKLNDADKSMPLRIKAVYSDKGYVSLPKYPDFTYVERMDTPKSKIAKLTIDRFEKVIPADVEGFKTTPQDMFELSTTPTVDALPHLVETANEDMLPF